MALGIPNSRNGHNPYNQHPTKNVICAFWLKGRCTRNPCRFLHPDASIQPPTQVPLQHFDGPQPQIRVCDRWVSGSCAYGEKCRFLHTWFHSDEAKHSFSMLTRLEGHKKAVTGVGLPSGSAKLYSGAKDGTVRVWDCNTGKCVKVINNGAEIGCLIIEGQWVFIGLPNTVKAWRLDVATGDYEEFVLDGPVGQVNAIAVCNGLLFAGSHDGVISAWRGSSDVNGFQLVASLEAHGGPVLSLSVQLERKRLFSSSADGTIKVWDLNNLQCIQTLSDHKDAVTCLLCSNEFLFSGSLDKTIKVWAANQGGKFELAYTHEEECGVVAVFGMADAQGKPVLFSSCKDFTVRLYDLPSFKERARLFSRKDVGAIQSGPGGLFFLGEGTGTVGVWNWMAEQQNMSQ
ncbi:hypothetical protein Ddye_024730 [Dipteronia dyeriana]|uniref:C3H1-type domain-containing protein n=1 Tax=Dipteronia dyeriana TaxID=168575 RepID=A0AAD9TVL6_9ROSI|nr:hypothetical protein Ddye_024730 [Dipteronia dyeriana]